MTNTSGAAWDSNHVHDWTFANFWAKLKLFDLADSTLLVCVVANTVVGWSDVGTDDGVYIL